MPFQTDQPFPTDQPFQTGQPHHSHPSALSTVADRRGRAVALARPAALTGPARLLVAVLAALATLAATVLLGVGGAAPAQAHDRIISSDPVDGAQLDAAPAALTMTFNTEPLAVEPQVVVTDTAGTVVAQGSPTIEGTSVTFPWPAELTGDTYTVAWRVVSSDGHPIEGTFAFAVAAAPEPAPTTATDEPAVVTPSATEDTTEATTSAGPEETDAPDDEARSIMPLLVGIGVLAAAAVVVALLIVRRRRQQD
ncbi:copper resistance protein CopC [Oerskovia turbata]|uniref:Copper resistance protein CopC n=1 Tax=Oerskovia turbata TaxID=1713 RepID=A0A4Q1KXA3_9CELL|nr:copper resistance CopC family protein [Oerskovia turbata]RXR25445.1 copper resistance protein CopC [Oerskovia turbata]RXR33914.1 copper resistance protein CopC [Oerskovia turbata]